MRTRAATPRRLRLRETRARSSRWPGRPAGSRTPSPARPGHAPQRAVAHRPARLGEDALGRAQIRPDAARDAGRAVGLLEQLGRQGGAERLQQGELAPLGDAARAELRVVEDALRAAIGAVQQGLVHRGEVEGVRQRVAHPPVGEDLAPRIEHQGRHAGRAAVRQQLALHPAVRGGGEVVGGRPALAGEFEAEVVLARLEGLDHHVAVAVVVVAHAVEIVLPPVDREIAPPIEGIAAIDDAPPRIDGLHAIRAAADRRDQRGLPELHVGVVGLRQDRHQPEDQRQLAVGRGGIEDEADRAFAGAFDPPDLLVVEPVVGPALLLQGLPGEHHVVDGDRTPVVEPRLGSQREGDRGPVVRHRDGLGDQPVERERLVPCPLEQALEHQMPAMRRHALDQERVEVVERPAHRAAQLAPLRRVGVDVVEVAEIGSVFQVPVHGDAVARLGGVRAARDRSPGERDKKQRRESGAKSHLSS